MKSRRFNPTIEELRPVVRKASYDKDRPFRSAMWYIRPWQVYFTYVLVRLRMGTLQVTVLWLAVTLLAYAVTAIGQPWAFVAGAVLVNIKIILDGVDGEVARYHKQFVSEAKDTRDWINGVYLDKAFHAIEHPLWGIALGMGLFRLTQDPWVWPAAISLSVYASFTRYHALLGQQMPIEYQDKVGQLTEADVLDNGNTAQDAKPSFLRRGVDTVDLWMRNGKYFNFTILICGLVDVSLQLSGRTPVVLYVYFVAAGAICPILIADRVIRTVKEQAIVRKSMLLSQNRQK